jgi:hypothetical protein
MTLSSIGKLQQNGGQLGVLEAKLLQYDKRTGVWTTLTTEVEYPDFMNYQYWFCTLTIDGIFEDHSIMNATELDRIYRKLERISCFS